MRVSRIKHKILRRVAVVFSVAFLIPLFLAYCFLHEFMSALADTLLEARDVLPDAIKTAWDGEE